MASTELLASKIVILEEEPKIPAVTALPSAVTLACGVTERGPVADARLVTSFEEYLKVFGGFTADSEVALAAHGFFYNGGVFLWVTRTTHFTDLTNPATSTAVAGSVMLQTTGTASSPAEVTTGNVGPFNLDDGDHIDITTNLGGPTVVTFNGQAATKNNAPTTEPFALVGGETLDVLVNGALQTVTFQPTDFLAPGAATALEVAARINADLTGAKCVLTGAAPGPYGLEIQTDGEGTNFTLDITGGTALPILLFTPGLIVGPGNVGNIHAVLGTEVEALVEGAIADVDVIVNGTGTLTYQTIQTGLVASIQIDPASTVDGVAKMDLDNAVHNGADATPENTLLCAGKTPYDNSDVSVVIANATSGDAAQFNLQVLDGGVVQETFPNLTMEVGASNYVETVVNDANLGSDLVAVTDQLLAYAALLKRPANGTYTMVGGDDGLVGLVDADYIGNEAGPTGLYCFDRVEGGTILIVPGKATSIIHNGMVTYAETHRNGSMFCVLDCPANQTAQQIVTYVETTASLLELTEFAAIYWPRIKVPNPSVAVFGDSEELTVYTSGWIAGLYARNDQRLGGIYESPAGIMHNFGVIRGQIGIEDDPTGHDEHEVLDERIRDLVYPKRINPITKLPSTPWHIDGGRTLKSTSNFPNVAERRGVIFIEKSIKQALIILKHRPNTVEYRMMAKRIITAFLTREMNKGAFRTTDPATAFYVDVSEQLNPPANVFAGIMTIRIGLATNKPMEYIVVVVTQDTRAYVESIAA